MEKNAPGFVDYPSHPKHVALGDLVCFRGQWRRVVDYMLSPGYNWPPYGLVAGDEKWYVRKDTDFPCPRIAAPLMDILSTHPYR